MQETKPGSKTINRSDDAFLYAKLPPKSGCSLGYPPHSRNMIPLTLPAVSTGRVLGQVLGKLCGDGLPGREHAEQFLRDAYRRNCRPNILHSYSQAIRIFLAFMQKTDKAFLAEITRGDIGAFVEHEQDGGMKPSTLRSRLVAIYAFLRFPIERGAVHPEVIARKMKVKLPELLPRAIDADEVGQLLAVIEDTRDRAKILLLLRGGMRIGELPSTRVNDINLREQKIMIYEAEKTFVGRAVYFSEDARQALEAWLKERDAHKELLFYGQWRERLTYAGARVRFTKQSICRRLVSLTRAIPSIACATPG